MMINKPSIIVSSLGRTGTNFFSKLINEILTDCSALHEPDIIGGPVGRGSKYMWRATINKLSDVGWKYLVFQKSKGRFSLIRISDSRVKGQISNGVAIEQLMSQRNDFVNQQSGLTYMESNYGYYGLIDLIPNVFNVHRVAYIIRDGRGWVQSHHNWGEAYGKGRLRSIFAHTWPKANDLPGDPYFEKWEKMTRFEKLCWAWNKLNGYALYTISKNPNAQLFLFENIFISKDKYDHLTEFVDFLSERHKGGRNLDLSGRLERKVHHSDQKFPDWSGWSNEQKRIFYEHCGDLMSNLSYEL